MPNDMEQMERSLALINIGVIEVQRAHGLVRLNKTAQTLLNCDRTEFENTQMQWEKIFSQAGAKPFAEFVKFINTKDCGSFAGILNLVGGVRGRVALSLFVSSGEIKHPNDVLYIVCQSVNHNFFQNKETQFYRNLFDNIHHGIILTNTNGIILKVNHTFRKITGFNSRDVVGKCASLLSSGKYQKKSLRDMKEKLISRHYWMGSVRNKCKDGSVNDQELLITTIFDERHKPLYYVGLFSYLPTARKTDKNSNFYSQYNHITSLPSRELLYEFVEKKIDAQKVHQSPFFLLFINIDNFSRINQIYGNSFGDKVLLEVKQRIELCLSDEHTLTHFSGDEFVIIFHSIHNDIASAELAYRLIKVISEPMLIEQERVTISASIGISAYPKDSNNAEELIGQSNLAMKMAKKSGKKNYQYYLAGDTSIVKSQLQLDLDLRVAVLENQFLMHYQPQYNLKTGRMGSVEALVRWKHPVNGLVYPGNFIPYAESSRTIVDIGRLVMLMACQECAPFIHHQYFERVAVNVSLLQLLYSNFIEFFTEVLAKSNLKPHQVEIEVTESSFSQENEKAVKVLRDLRALGCEVSIDDFGTGYSSLSRLQSMPISALKIDKSFIDSILDEKRSVVPVVLSLAKQLGLYCIAEGIEQPSQAEALLQLGCDVGQGYYYSRPLAIEDLIAHYHSGWDDISLHG